ncbi:hypothetical protein [Streptomyces filamentosus]
MFDNLSGLPVRTSLSGQAAVLLCRGLNSAPGSRYAVWVTEENNAPRRLTWNEYINDAGQLTTFEN